MWVKWTPADFLNGVVGLDIVSVGVYSVMLNLIYDNGGPIPNTDANLRKIARRCGMRIDTFLKTVAALVEDGKLVAIDGVLSNSRAEVELGSRASRVAKLVSNFQGGDQVGSNKTNKNNGHSVQLGDQMGEKSPTDKKEKEKEKEKRRIAPRAPAMRASRIDPNRTLTAGNITFARARGLRPKEIEHEHERFVRYYRGLPPSARNATSADWDAVWESWVLRKAADLGREPLIDGVAETADDPASYSREMWSKCMEIYRMTGVWNSHWGAEPGFPGCKVPKELVNHS